MELITKNFGKVEVSGDKVITFAEGLPGFPEEKEFVILRDEDAEEESNWICWLQAVNNSDLAFVLVDAFKIMSYNPLIEEEELAALGENPDDDYLIYNIAVIPDNIKNMRVNLRAPLVINTYTQQGKQIIAGNEEYDIRHYLFAQASKEK